MCGISRRCIRQNCGGDPVHTLAVASVLTGCIGGPIAYFAGEKLLAITLEGLALTNGIHAIREACLRPWSDLGHSASDLRASADTLANAERETKKELDELKSKLEKMQTELQEALEKQQGLLTEREKHLTQMSDLEKRIAEQNTKSSEAADAYQKVLFDLAEEKKSGETLERQRMAEIGTLKNTVQEMLSITTSVAKETKDLETGEAAMAAQNRELNTHIGKLRTEIDRLATEIAKKDNENKLLQEAAHQVHEAEKIARWLQDERMKMEALVKQKPREPIHDGGRLTPPKTGNMQ